MENKFFLRRENRQSERTHTWQVIFSFLLVLAMSIGNAWGDTTYKLFCGTTADVDGTNLNVTDFWTSATPADGTNSDTYSKYITFGGNVSGTTSLATPANYVAYSVKTTSTEIKVIVYNKNNSTQKLYFHDVKEKITSGKATASLKSEDIASKTKDKEITYTSTNDGKATIYISAGKATDTQIYQIIVTEKGTALTDLYAGYAGYSINLNKGRVAAKAGEITVIDKLNICPSSDHKPTNNSEIKLVTFGTHYVSFTAKEDCALKLTVNSGVKYTLGSAKDEAGATEYGGAAGTYTTVLTKDQTYFINPVSGNTNDFKITKIEFVPVYTVSFDAGEGSGTMAAKKYVEDAEVTIPACTFTAPSGKEFTSWTISPSQTVTDGKFAMPAEDVTLTANWAAAAEKYTVEYYDGESKLGEEEVEVGEHPTATGITTTKEWYTFASWQLNSADIALDAASWASVAKDATVTLTARYTGPNYFTTSVDFEEGGSSAVSGIAAKNIVASVAGEYDGGKASENWAYKGWKIKSNGATVKVLVKAGKQLTFKFGYLAATGHVAISNDATNYSVTGASNVEDNPLKFTTYSWIKNYDAIYTFTTGSSSAAVIKAIYVNDVYNVTYTDETGDASGVASNVAEVTLPTPTETTVGTSTFTGWTANKVVYDGETAKAVGAALEAGKTYKLTDNTVFTAQWAAVTDFDVKFFQGYGEPDAQIGTTQVISTGNYATAPADPSREGYNFKGWSYDATEANIVNVAEYAIIAATNFTAIWKQVFAVTFDGAGSVNVESGSKVASPNSPSQAGKVFQGWYNGENKWNFADNVTAAMALTSKWEDANANHFYYNYKDAFHYDGFAYKTPEGKVDEGAGASNIAITTPYTLFSGAAGISSIVATNAIYDSKNNWVNAYLKINTSEDSYLTFTIASGYTAVLKMKMGGYSSNPTVTLKKGEDVVDAASGTIGGVASTENNYNEITYNLVAGTYTMTTATKTLYISHIDLEATAIPAHVVTYMPNGGTGADFVTDNDATQVLDGSTMFTAPSGQVFNGWKDGDNNDVAVGAVVENDMTLYAQWINQYAVTFNMQGHGAAVDPQYIKHGAKVTKPADPAEIGYIFGGWFTDTDCTEGNEFNFNTTITENKELFAKWTAFDGCTELWPATSGDAPTAKNQEINLQTGSKGGKIYTAGAKNDKYNESFAYTAYGLGLQKGGADSIRVELNYEMKVGTVITVVAYNNSDDKARGFKLQNLGKSEKATMTQTAIGSKEYTYTVEEGDGLAGNNAFLLQRSETSYLTSIKVSNCGAAIVYHDLTSAVDPAGKGTVTLGASSVREGYTTTAEYSAIDEAYEFDEWQISGTGATIADASANPAVITMGTADAVVTLKLKAATPKHTVTYNAMGHGVAPASEEVKEGAKVTKPADPVADNWAFGGWYKENTLENAWDFAVDVMGTSDIELFAKWEDETGAIKLFDGEGNLNTTNFVSAPKNADPITIETVDYPCLTQFAANRTSLGGAVPADFVQYNATTDAAKVKFTLYNTNSGEKSALLYMVEEGDTEFTPVEIKVPGQTIFTTSYYTFNSTKNRSFYLCAKDRSNIRVLQVTVMDNGTAIKQAGQAGYSMNFNKGRMYVKNGTPASFEGATINVSSEYKVANNSSLATTSYISFTTTVDKMVLKVKRAGGNYYVSQDPENKGTTYNKNEEIELSPAGTWYLGSTSSGSAASFSKIEFIAPKCAEPEFNALVNSELCEGDAYVALDGTATVADAGVPVYQWYNADGDVLIEGAESATYTPTADGSYYVIATNKLAGYSDNEKKSATVTVEHFASAEITSAPADVRQTVGENATLTVVATGKAPLNYQWYTCDENGDNAVLIAGAEEASYTVNVTANLDQFYKVVVTSGCGEASAVAHVVEWVALPQVNVSASTTWDWVNAGENIKLSGTTVPAKNEECVMANVKVGDKMPTNDETFNSQALLFSGENVRAKDGSRYYASVGYMKFTTTIAGKVTVEFSTNTDDKLRGVKINGQASETSDKKATVKTFSAVVPAGEVSIVGYEGETANAYVRISKIIFSTTDVEGADYVRDVTEGRYGTICLPNGGVMVGAEIFELAYYGATSQKFFFDEVPSGEMEAGKPYLFLPREGATQLGVFYTDNANAAAQTVNGFVGYIGANAEDYMQVPDNGNCYIISNNLYRQVMPGGTAYILSNRAYIDMSGATNIEPAKVPGRRRIGLNVEGTNTATGIDAINASEKPMKIMIDGQIYILRGEKMYDVTGKLVK